MSCNVVLDPVRSCIYICIVNSRPLTKSEWWFFIKLLWRCLLWIYWAPKEPAPAVSSRGLWAQRTGHSTGCVAFAPWRASLWAEAFDRKPRNPADVQLDLSPYEIHMKSIEWMENDGNPLGSKKNYWIPEWNDPIKWWMIWTFRSIQNRSVKNQRENRETPLLSRGPGARVSETHCFWTAAFVALCRSTDRNNPTLSRCLSL